EDARVVGILRAQEPGHFFVETGRFEGEAKMSGGALELEPRRAYRPLHVHPVLDQAYEDLQDRVAQSIRAAAAEHDALGSTPKDRRCHHRAEHATWSVAMEAAGMNVLLAHQVVDDHAGRAEHVSRALAVGEGEGHRATLRVDDTDVGGRSEGVLAACRAGAA